MYQVPARFFCHFLSGLLVVHKILIGNVYIGSKNGLKIEIQIMMTLSYCSTGYYFMEYSLILFDA
jgi:hypothetical protein